MMTGRGVLRLRVGPTALHAEVVSRRGVDWAGEANYASNVDLVDAIARLAAEAPAPCRRLTVTVERPPAQLRTLEELPPINARALRALVALQAGRFFRRNGHTLVTDAVWIGDRARRVARAAAVDEPVVEAIAAGARTAGLFVATITPADEAAPLALLPTSERAARERAAHRRIRRLAIATAAVWVSTGALYVARLTWERHAIDRELAAFERPLSAVVAARRELRTAEATVDAVTTAQRLRSRSLAALGAVALALPDSAVLTSFAWSDTEPGVLSGVARQAADVVADLDRAAAVPAPRLEGPVVRETFAGRAWERFTIAFGAAPHD